MNEDELSEYIRNSFRLNIPDYIIEDSFPHIERPSINEMETAIDLSLQGLLIPQNIEMKLSRKPTKEMLTDFCKARGLTWEYDRQHQLYQFRIRDFYKEIKWPPS